MASTKRPGVLVTRPDDQFEQVSTLIEQAHAHAVPFPLLDIMPLSRKSLADQNILDSDRYGLSIFISRNAVRFGVPRLKSLWRGLPEQMLWIAVGRSTATEMARHAITGSFPLQASSEGVLSMQETQRVAGKRVLIVRGEGGRETLATTLRQRGAKVDYLEVYRREKHPWTPVQLAQLVTDEQIQAVMLTSGEALTYFSELLGRADGNLTLLLPSARLVNLARQLGFDRIRLTGGADSQAMASGLSSWMAEQPRPI